MSCAAFSTRTKGPDTALRTWICHKTAKSFDFLSREHLQNLSITGESDHPFAISFEDVAAAAFRIRKGIVKTPCEV